MTTSALLLGRQFYDLQPSTRLKYATLGLLFVNVSIGGTLTHFAAPPVLMVARAGDLAVPGPPRTQFAAAGRVLSRRPGDSPGPSGMVNSALVGLFV